MSLVQLSTARYSRVSAGFRLLRHLRPLPATDLATHRIVSQQVLTIHREVALNLPQVPDPSPRMATSGRVTHRDRSSAVVSAGSVLIDALVVTYAALVIHTAPG
jgi:hypothetical protein